LPCEVSDADWFLSEPPDAVISAVKRMTGDFLVLGAGGKMGLHVCLMLRRALDANGDARRVVAVSRFGQEGSRQEFERFGIETIPCDLSDPDAVNALEVIENVIFMAGAKFGTSGQTGLLKLMNETVPAMVGEKFQDSRITAFSTGCVYSFCPVESGGASETSETEPVGDYAQSCLGREKAFRKVARENGTQVALIRLNYSVEFRYGIPVDIAKKVLAGKPIDVTTGHVNLIWQRDAVAQTLLAHELASTEPFVINITGAGTHRVRDLAARLGGLLGCEPIFSGQEADTAWLSDASLSHRLFGPPETSTGQMLQWIAAWQLADLPTLNKPTGFEKRDGNF